MYKPKRREDTTGSFCASAPKPTGCISIRWGLHDHGRTRCCGSRAKTSPRGAANRANGMGAFSESPTRFNDSRLKNWTGYTEKRYFDESGLPIDAETAKDTPGATSRELIPLALYALEYPKVPLVLVDFRDTHKPKNREMLRLATADAVTGVLGISKYGNWPYFAGSTTYNFVQSRHGDPNNRTARLKAFSQVRRWLTLEALWTRRCVRNCKNGWRSWE